MWKTLKGFLNWLPLGARTETKENSTIALVQRTLEKHGAMAYTTIVAAGASDLPAIKYIAPFSGCAIAEY